MDRASIQLATDWFYTNGKTFDDRDPLVSGQSNYDLSWTLWRRFDTQAGAYHFSARRLPTNSGSEFTGQLYAPRITKQVPNLAVVFVVPPFPSQGHHLSSALQAHYRAIHFPFSTWRQFSQYYRWTAKVTLEIEVHISYLLMSMLIFRMSIFPLPQKIWMKPYYEPGNFINERRVSPSRPLRQWLPARLSTLRTASKRSENGYRDKDIRMLTDETDNTPPTKVNILKALSWLVDGAGSDDSLFIHYSGHGSQIVDTDGDEVDEKDEGTTRKAQVTALLLPAYELPLRDDLGGQRERAVPASVLDSISADVICWSGAKDNQAGADTRQGGVMMRAFIDAFQENTSQSYKEFLHSIRVSIVNSRYNQIAQLGSSRKIIPEMKFIL
ncbi:hypothetical protein F5146DRAFT_996524 [Armillaria mellea]|nr:hypothetical protein F5146DRAFT_996524 [Armillaria mellea]